MRSIAVLASVALGGCCGRSASPPPCAPPVAGAPLPSAPRLVDLRPAPAPQVLLETTFFRLPQGTQEPSLGMARGAGLRAVPSAEASALSARWTAGAAEVLAAPSIVTVAGDEASVVLGESRTELGTAHDGDALAPGTTGLSMWMRPTTAGSGLDLDVRASWHPAPSSPAARLTARSQVPAGQVLVLWSEPVPTDKGEARIAAIVRARTLPGS